MRKGPVPKFTVRERTSSAIASLISETNIAKALLRAGYPLLNQWTEQKFGGLDINRQTVPHDWLWPLTVADAIGSDIDLIVRDAATNAEMTLDLSSFLPNTRLREIKAQLRSSGRRLRLHIR
jgi:hypothetical protein